MKKIFLLIITTILFYTVNAQFNHALYTDGIQDYIEIPDNDALDLTNNFTVECWINANDANGPIIRKGWCYGGDNSYQLELVSGKISWMWFNSGNCNYINRYLSSDAVINIGECYHITVVHSDSEVKFYLNNNLISGELTDGSYSDINASNQTMTISSLKNYNGEYLQHFAGKIDELRFWNYKLSQTEITNYSNAPLNGDETGLVAYFDMEDSGVGTDLTITNKATISGEIIGTAYGSATSPIFSNSCNTNSDSPFNKSLYTDGIQDYIEIPDNDALDLITNFTVECWINANDANGPVIRKGWCYGGDNSYQLELVNGKISWMWFNSGNCNYANRYLSTDAVINVGECYHITVIHSDTEVKFYLNNNLISGELTDGSYSEINVSSQTMTISSLKNYNGEYLQHFAGKVDELRFWNYKLSQTEITNYSNAPLNGDEVGLVAYFDMEDTGVGTNLTITNKATVSGEITGTAFGSATSPYFTYSCSSVGIEDIIEEEQVQIYPNPSSDMLYLNGYNSIKSISLININGQIVKSISNSTKININNIPKGIYFVKVVTDSKIITKKIIKI